MRNLAHVLSVHSNKEYLQNMPGELEDEIRDNCENNVEEKCL
jgi:hypothetical protein